jgi:DNA polymerase-4
MVRQETGLTVSAGVASNKLVAKIASDLEKPNGLTVVQAGHEQAFLAPLAIGRLWGVGKTTEKRLGLMGVRTIGDLVRLSVNMLESTFGQTGSWLHQSAQGLDNRPVQPSREAKSLGNEETFDTDLQDYARIRQELLALANKVGGRLRRHGLMGRTITMKIRYHDFTTQTRSLTLATATNDHGEIFSQSLYLLKKTEAGSRPIRLLGVSVAKLAPPEGAAQINLFDVQEKKQKRAKVNAAMDAIQDRFGGQAILPATLLKE